MEYIQFFQIISQIFPFIWPEYSQRKADEGPEVHDRVVSAVVLAQFMNLGMAVVTPGNAVVRAGCLDLLVFQFSILQTLILEPGLQKSAAAAAAVVIGSVGLHVDKIFFAHNGSDHKPKVFGNGIAIALSYDLAGILNREFDFQVLVPVGIDLQLAFTNPFGIIFIDVLNFKIVLEVKFFQSGPD